MGQSKEAKLVKNTAIYTIGNFGSKILSFLIVPLYTYYLTTKEFGTYDTIVSLITLLSPMCILAIHEGLLRWLLKSQEKHGDILGTGFSMLLAFLIISDIIIGAICIAIKWEYTVVFLVLINLASLDTAFHFIARGEKKNKAFAVSGVLYTFVMLALNVAFIVYLRMGVHGMLWSMAIAHLCSVLYLIIVMRKTIKIREMRFNKSLAVIMFTYSIMLVPNNISWWVMNVSDRLMLTAMVGAAATGIYSLANKFPSIVTVLHQLFYQAWQEQAVLEYDSKSRDEYYTKVFNSYMKLACCAVAVLIPFSKLFIVLFMDKSYLDAFRYLGILYLGSIFSSFAGFYGTGYISAKDTKNAMKTTIIGAVINAGINLALIPVIGIWAACISTLIGNIAVWAIRVKQTKKYFSINVEWKIFIIIMIFNTVFSIAICFTDMVGTVIMLIVSLILTVVINKSMIVSIFNSIVKKLRKGKSNQ